MNSLEFLPANHNETFDDSRLLKEIILRKIVDTDDVDEVQLLTEIIVNIDKQKAGSKESSEILLKKQQNRRIALIKQGSQIISGFVLLGLGAYTFYVSDNYMGSCLMGTGLANLGSPLKNIQSLLSPKSTNDE